MRSEAVSWLVVLAIAASCASPLPSLSPAKPAATSSPSDAWAGLHRPFVEPPSGDACSVAIGRHLSDKFAPGFGRGPAFAVGGERAIFEVDPATAADGWLDVKVLWVGEPNYRGLVLVRGFSVHGEARVRFSGLQEDELQIDWTKTTSADWREWASITLVSQPGCYAWQVDTSAGSELIVFKVLLGSP